MASIDKTTDDYKNYLEQLLNLGQTLNSSLKLEEVLNIAIDSVVDFVRAERGFIMLFGDNKELEIKASKNVNVESMKNMQNLSRTILNASARKGRSILSVDAQKDNRFSGVDSVMLTGMRSVMCVPLRVKKKIIGVIYLDNRLEEGMFNDTQLNMLETFSNQAAVAIENARLHENLIKSYDKQIKLSKELHEQEKIRYASEEANRLKSDFVNIVSHELRSPMTVVKTYTSALSRDIETGRNRIDEKTKRDIYQTIDREVDRLINMISKLLDVSSIDAGKQMMLDLKETNIITLVKYILKLQSTSKFFKRNRHKIIKVIPKNLTPLVCDHEKMLQILSNLIENALKYSPDGGDIKLKISALDDVMKFEVSDQGMGISEEDRLKLFKKFQRVDRSGRTIPGTGLGLYLIKNLVELHGGKIFVSSKLGEGSNFTFNIPLKIKEEDIFKK